MSATVASCREQQWRKSCQEDDHWVGDTLDCPKGLNWAPVPGWAELHRRWKLVGQLGKTARNNRKSSPLWPRCWTGTLRDGTVNMDKWVRPSVYWLKPGVLEWEVLSCYFWMGKFHTEQDGCCERGRVPRVENRCLSHMNMRQRGQLALTSALGIYRHATLHKSTLTVLRNCHVTSPASDPVLYESWRGCRGVAAVFPAFVPAWKWIPSVPSRVNINLACFYRKILKSKKTRHYRSELSQTGCYSRECHLFSNSFFPLFFCTLSHSWWSLRSLEEFNIASHTYRNICCCFTTTYFF